MKRVGEEGRDIYPSNRAQTIYSATSCVPSELRTTLKTRTLSFPSSYVLRILKNNN